MTTSTSRIVPPATPNWHYPDYAPQGQLVNFLDAVWKSIRMGATFSLASDSLLNQIPLIKPLSGKTLSAPDKELNTLIDALHQFGGPLIGTIAGGLSFWEDLQSPDGEEQRHSELKEIKFKGAVEAIRSMREVASSILVALQIQPPKHSPNPFTNYTKPFIEHEWDQFKTLLARIDQHLVARDQKVAPLAARVNALQNELATKDNQYNTKKDEPESKISEIREEKRLKSEALNRQTALLRTKNSLIEEIQSKQANLDTIRSRKLTLEQESSQTGLQLEAALETHHNLCAQIRTEKTQQRILQALIDNEISIRSNLETIVVPRTIARYEGQMRDLQSRISALQARMMPHVSFSTLQAASSSSAAATAALSNPDYKP